MISILLLSVLFLLGLGISIGVLGLGAGMAGCKKHLLKSGMFCTLLILATSVVFGVSRGFLSSTDLIAAHILSMMLFLLQQILNFYWILRIFELTLKRAFAVYGFWIALNIMYFLTVLLLVKPAIMEGFSIPITQGMSPSMEAGDRFMVNKLISLRRWDIVAFQSPHSGSTPAVIFCKRIIALPGEQLRFSQGAIYINGTLMNAPPVLAGRFRVSPVNDPRPRYREDETIVLGNEEYFVIGDSVEQSFDSRGFGPIGRSSILGVVDFIYWPLTRRGILR